MSALPDSSHLEVYADAGDELVDPDLEAQRAERRRALYWRLVGFFEGAQAADQGAARTEQGQP